MGGTNVLALATSDMSDSRCLDSCCQGRVGLLGLFREVAGEALLRATMIVQWGEESLSKAREDILLALLEVSNKRMLNVIGIA